MVVFPPCKINLGLQITGKRADGYHDLVTCFYPVPWCDILEAIPSQKFSFTSSGISIPGDNADNLCIKAYSLLKKDFDLKPVALHLHKIIPMGAGLGGGSSDAAWTLQVMSQLFNLDLSRETLRRYASQLGSDCAFFIENRPMFGSGRGEILTDTVVNLKGKFIVIVKPDVHVSTAEAYAGVTPKIPETSLKEILEKYPLEQWKDFVQNDFEVSVFKKHPVIKKVKDQLYTHGAQYASMSGSGSAVFGIFTSSIDLKNIFEGYAYYSGRL
jgi:4-diphosphocytidyl-2-C-methyl-D-erythritol kinase